MAATLEQTSALATVYGRILDTDSHEWIPTPHWEKYFGAGTAPFAMMMNQMPSSGHHGFYTANVEDEVEIDPDTIWHLKGSSAPAAIDMSRRPAVLDAMGVDRQLVFPGGPGIFGPILMTCPTERVLGKLLSPELADMARQMGITREAAGEIGGQLLRCHNDWCLTVAGMNSRVRPVAVVIPTSVPEAMAEAERLLAAGIRAVMIPSDYPPAGLSPADTELDPFWALFAEANVPILLHISGELNFQSRTEWSNVPLFQPNVTDLAEIPADPYSFSVVHFSAQNFLSTMILGGVFERHPELRLGVIELSSHWVGPMAENLRMWTEVFSRRMAGQLSLSPSEYLQRNVRVSSFWWEPVDKYIDRHGMPEVYAFSSDYPHHEGGPESAHRFADTLTRLGPDMVEKFFVSNGELLLPE